MRCSSGIEFPGSKPSCVSIPDWKNRPVVVSPTADKRRSRSYVFAVVVEMTPPVKGLISSSFKILGLEEKQQIQEFTSTNTQSMHIDDVVRGSLKKFPPNRQQITAEHVYPTGRVEA